MKPRLTHLTLILLVSIGVLLSVTTLWRSGPGASRRIPQPDPERAPLTANGVRAEGRVTCYPGAEIVVGTELAGLLVELHVEENHSVAKGALIAQLKSDVLRASLAEAQARVSGLSAELDLAVNNVERDRELLATHTLSQQQFEQADRDLAVVRARLASAQATVTRLQATLAQTRILAPISGLVLRRHVQPGECVEAFAPIATIADITRVRVEAEVDEYDADRIRVGQVVSITAEGFPGQNWAGTVEEVPAAVVDKGLRPSDPARPVDVRVLLAKIAFTTPTPLKLGQRVEVEIAEELMGNP